MLYSDVKNANFAPTDIYKKFLFRYAVFANNVSAANNCAPGAAEINGNDLIVSLDTTPGGCGKTFSQVEQRGVFMHMLGHNIGFNSGAVSENPVNNSVVYQSVMNYRYMISGIPGRTGVITQSYSFGANGCDACTTSPLQECVSTRAVNACNHNPNCDCDVAEWPNIYVNPVTTDPLPWVN